MAPAAGSEGRDRHVAATNLPDPYFYWRIEVRHRTTIFALRPNLNLNQRFGVIM